MNYHRVHHVSLNVRNLELAAKFYTEILLFKEIERPPIKSKGIWFAIGDSGQQLHLIEYEAGKFRTGGIDPLDGHFALLVDSYTETIGRLDNCGMKYDARPDSPAGYAQIFIEDPDHNIIEFDFER